jgi:hypothetical protein
MVWAIQPRSSSLCGQHMGLLVVQVLDAVLHPPQEFIGGDSASAVACGISPAAATRCSAACVGRVRSSGNWPPRTTCSSCTVNSISRMPPRDSLTSLARSGRPALRLAACSRIWRCSTRSASNTL